MAATALLALAAAPAGAQVPEVPPLGFQIDRAEGAPGEIVNGQVDVANVAEHCVTELEEFQARFNDLTLDVLAFNASDPLWVRFFPEGTTNLLDVETHDQLAYALTLFVTLGLASDQDVAEDALPQTFVLTFADIATQEPVGELGSFDPATGEGSVTVPDIEPGPWALAATCLGPTFDFDALEAGIRSSGVFLEEIGAPAVDPSSPEFEAFAQEFLDSDATGFDVLLEFLEAIGPDLLQPIVTPDALGVQLFNVLPDPQDLIAGIVADIDGLVADGELKAGQARGLTRPLDNASRSLDRDKIGPACNQLADFVAEANEKVADGALDPAAATDLIAQAEAIQAQVGCA
jgi:hypothetical protein